MGLVGIWMRVEHAEVVSLLVDARGDNSLAISLLLLHADGGEVCGFVGGALGFLLEAEGLALALGDAAVTLTGELLLSPLEFALQVHSVSLVGLGLTPGVALPGLALVVIAEAALHSLGVLSGTRPRASLG